MKTSIDYNNYDEGIILSVLQLSKQKQLVWLWITYEVKMLI